MSISGLHVTLAALTGVMLAWAGPALSQDAAAGTASENETTINVIGRKADEAEAKREANDFVRRAGVANGDNPIARWNAPVCPKVLGIQEEYAAIVERKIRAIATTADIKLAPLPCSTNIVISFATDARQVVQRIATKSPRRLAEVPITARPELLKGGAPVRWWYTTQLTGADGISTSGDAPPASAGTAEGGGSALALGAQSVQAYSSSIIRTQVVRALRSATVLIDVNLAQGVPLDSVAAYAAMVAFAEITPNDNPMPNSILGLFGKGSRFTAPTDWDITFLKTLYSIPPDRAGWKQRRMLVGQIADAAITEAYEDPTEGLTEGLTDEK